MKQTIWTPAFIAKSAMIAAIYVVATGLLSGMGFGQVQIRIAEALYVLALYTLSAVPGLTVGCLIANLLWSPFGVLDVLLGTLATFLGVAGTYALREKGPVAALIPPVVFNALLVPLVLMWCDGQGYWLSALYIAISEAISCYALGLPLQKVVARFAHKL